MVASVEDVDQIVGEEQDGYDLTEGLDIMLTDQARAAKEAKLRTEMLLAARRLEKANALASKETLNVIEMLQSGDPRQELLARKTVRRAEEQAAKAAGAEERLENVEAAANDGPLENPAAACLWRQKMSKTHNKPYWRHAKTGESVWVKPAEVVAEEAAEVARRASQPQRAASSSADSDARAFELVVEDDDRIDPRRIAARRRWHMIRQFVQEGMRKKRELRDEFHRQIRAKVGNGMSMATCHVCNADFATKMCRECGTREKDAYEDVLDRRRKEAEDNARTVAAGGKAAVTSEEAVVRLFEEYNGKPYHYLCTMCDGVVHASKGKKGAHARLHILKDTTVEEAPDLDTQLHSIHKRQKGFSPEEVFVCTVLIVLFLAFPSMIKEIAMLTKCVAIPTTGKSFLEADMRIECSDPGYSSWRTMSIIFFFSYGVGLPTLAFLVLALLAGKNRTGLLRKKVLSSLGFLYSGYRLKRYVVDAEGGSLFVRTYSRLSRTHHTTHRYYWETLILYRKMIVVVIAVFYQGRQQYQVFVWKVVTLATLIFFTPPPPPPHRQ